VNATVGKSFVPGVYMSADNARAGGLGFKVAEVAPRRIFVYGQAHLDAGCTMQRGSALEDWWGQLVAVHRCRPQCQNPYCSLLGFVAG